MPRQKPKLGQHFLTNQHIARQIAAAITLWGEKYELLVEVGGGWGALTRHLVGRGKLVVVEVDGRLAGHLCERFGDRLTVVCADVLKVNLRKLSKELPFGIAGNLPFHISSTLLGHILTECMDLCVEMVFTVQKEVAERWGAVPPSRRAGVLTPVLHTFYLVEQVFEVEAHHFFPPPQVDSAVVRMERRPRPLFPASSRTLLRLSKLLFQQRRKQIKTILRQALPSALSLLPEELKCRRPEELSLSEWHHLYEVCSPLLQ